MEKAYAIWLLEIFGAGSRISTQLCEYFGSFEKIYMAAADELAATEFISAKMIEKMQNKNLDRVNRILSDCDELGIDIVTAFDVKYPSALKNIDDYPVVLFIIGTLPVENSLLTAVVGSRKPSIYGLNMAEKFSYDLSRAGMVIVSGMARGIDSAAHRGAIRAGAKTVAVLGCGAEIVYPAENRELKKLIQQNGAVISEFPPGTAPLPAYFPIRNRIISGMSDAVLIIEGKASSGSGITANLAKTQGKEVFCLPGNVDNPLSAAPNRLIREGARAVTCAEDLLIDMAIDNPVHLTETIYSESAEKARKNEKLDALTPEQRKIAEVLDKNTPMHIDKICFTTGIEISVVNQCLFLLELKGIVKQLPGKQYIQSL